MVEHRCLGNRRIYFQHGRIHPHRAFERHRTKLRHGGDRNGCDDYGLCVDCRADFAAAAANAADAQLWNGAACCWSCLRCITVSHILSFASWRFEILLASRVGIVLTHAVFWSITASLAVRIALVGKGNQALGLLSTGTVMAVLAKSLPRLPSVNTGSLSSLPLLLKRKKLMLLYAVTVPVITAHFTAYSYIEPFVIQIGGFSARQVTVVPGLYGLAGFAASYLFGKWFAKHPRAFLAGAVSLIALSSGLLLPLAHFPAAIYALVFVWGTAIVVVSLGMVAKVLDFASDAADLANSIYSELYNVGIGGGALLGH
ncbi:MFS transporter [Neisseria gonorrhoeae]